MMKKRPNRDLEGSQFRDDWPIGLQAHVDRANWLINEETDEAFRSILKPALDDFVADKISATCKQSAAHGKRKIHSVGSGSWDEQLVCERKEDCLPVLVVHLVRVLFPFGRICATLSAATRRNQNGVVRDATRRASLEPFRVR
jgi:hypothetical protein